MMEYHPCHKFYYTHVTCISRLLMYNAMYNICNTAFIRLDIMDKKDARESRRLLAY